MPVPAAQYLRMSTEHQQYSLGNQAAAIEQYATQHGFYIAKTYADSGRSGLVIKNRPALANLLADVVAHRHAFKAVLVYDVSRWGRFQDADEAAHYEFLCRSAGIPVHYCAEQFANDGSMVNVIMKTLKRTMAAEYSRELGVKIRATQARLAALGYKMGAVPGYAMRRVLVDTDGTFVRELKPGERKSFAGQHVVLAPGPKSEIDVVQEIYRLALLGNRPVAIAGVLNRRGLLYADGKRWRFYNVLEILKNPKYAGTYVWGTTSQRLTNSTVRVSPTEWVRCQNAFTPIVSREIFDRVQELLSRKKVYSDEEMLNALRRLLKRRGRLSESLILNSRDTPSASQYTRRFGSVNRAYQLIGYTPVCSTRTTPQQRARAVALRNAVVLKLARACSSVVTLEQRDDKRRPHLIVDDDIRVSVLVCLSKTTVKGHLRWSVYPVETESQNVTLVCALDRTNTKIRSAYVVAPGIRRCTVRRLRDFLRWGFHLRSALCFPRSVREVAQHRIDPNTLSLNSPLEQLRCGR
jgi:DNA invertase Pin-like site-specific DNA recombinase